MEINKSTFFSALIGILIYFSLEYSFSIVQTLFEFVIVINMLSLKTLYISLIVLILSVLLVFFWIVRKIFRNLLNSNTFHVSVKLVLILFVFLFSFNKIFRNIELEYLSKIEIDVYTKYVELLTYSVLFKQIFQISILVLIVYFYYKMLNLKNIK